MHAAANLGGREGRNRLALVINLAVICFQPAIKLIPHQPAIYFIRGCIGDWSDTEELVEGSGWRSIAGCLNRSDALRLHLINSRHSNSSPVRGWSHWPIVPKSVPIAGSPLNGPALKPNDKHKTGTTRSVTTSHSCVHNASVADKSAIWKHKIPLLAKSGRYSRTALVSYLCSP